MRAVAIGLPVVAATGRAPSTRASRLLFVVAVLHAASPPLVLGARWWFSVDETLYLSQLNAHVPAGLFSAPRARGPTLLAAPGTLLTTSTTAVQVWLSLLAGVGCYLAFRPWVRLRLGYVVALAALLFSSVWVAICYRDTVMPDPWVACAALLRPSDAPYLVVALGLSCRFLRAPWRRRGPAVAALAVSFAAGAAEWVVEAYARYGGLAARIHAAHAKNGGPGPHLAGAGQARTPARPPLCRGGCHVRAALVYRLWWILGRRRGVVAVLAARRSRELSVEIVAVVTGTGLAGQYPLRDDLRGCPVPAARLRAARAAVRIRDSRRCRRAAHSPAWCWIHPRGTSNSPTSTGVRTPRSRRTCCAPHLPAAPRWCGRPIVDLPTGSASAVAE